MSHVKITRTTSLTVSGQCRLTDLRQLVSATEGLPGDTTVSYSHYPGDQRDPSQLTLTVNDAP